MRCSRPISPLTPVLLLILRWTATTTFSRMNRMGQVAKASLKRLIHGVDPVQQSIRFIREKVVVFFQRWVMGSTGLKGLVGLMHRVTGQLEQ